MNFEFTPIAEASVTTLMQSINKVIINPIIFFLFALAMVYFLYGVAQYLLSPDNEEVHKKSKTHMLYGVIGLFIMVAVFGIMNLILNTVGEDKIRIENTGDYEIINRDADGGGSSLFDKYEEDTNLNYGGSNFISDTDVDLRASKNINLTNVPVDSPDSFNISPFRVKYVESSYCWREEIHVFENTEYKALQEVKKLAFDRYNSDPSVDVIMVNKPMTFGVLTAYDEVNKKYHTWMDARAPINGGTDNSCILAVDVDRTEELPLDSYVLDNPFTTPIPTTTDLSVMSSDEGIFTNIYKTDDLFIRVRGIGMSSLLELARDIAIKEAFAALNIEIEINNLTIVYPMARILEEKYIFNEDTNNYEYWVAIESSKSNSGRR